MLEVVAHKPCYFSNSTETHRAPASLLRLASAAVGPPDPDGSAHRTDGGVTPECVNGVVRRDPCEPCPAEPVPAALPIAAVRVALLTMEQACCRCLPLDVPAALAAMPIAAVRAAFALLGLELAVW